MYSQETVSVVIVTHNQERYVGEAIESAINQTAPPEEILVIDDFSSDSTNKILTRYEREYPNTVEVVTLRSEHGIPATRNVGIERATGDLVTFLDGDDYFHKKKIEKETQAIIKNDYDFAFSNFEYVGPAGDRLKLWDETEQFDPTQLLQRCLTRDFPDGNLFRDELVRRELLQSVGGYDETLPILEDWDLRIRLSESGEGVYVPEPLTAYRQHGSGISDRSTHTTSIKIKEKIIKKHIDKVFEQELDKIQSMRRLLETVAESRLYRAFDREDLLRSVVYFALFVASNPSELRNLPEYANRAIKNFSNKF